MDFFVSQQSRFPAEAGVRVRTDHVRKQQNRQNHGLLAGLAWLLCLAACTPAVIRDESQTSRRARGTHPGGPRTLATLPDDDLQPRRPPVGRRAALVDVDDAALSDIDDDDDTQRAPQPKPLTINAKMTQRCRQVRPIIETAARQGGQDPLLMLAIAWVESGFNPDAESRAGAQGVMQLVPRTSRVFGCTDPGEPRCGAMAATAYFSRLLRMFDGDTVYALCAYHAGHVRPQKAWRRGDLPANLSYATKVLEARSRLERNGCDGK